MLKPPFKVLMAMWKRLGRWSNRIVSAKIHTPKIVCSSLSAFKAAHNRLICIHAAFWTVDGYLLVSVKNSFLPLSVFIGSNSVIFILAPIVYTLKIGVLGSLI